MSNTKKPSKNDPDKELSRRNLIIASIVGVTVILTFFIELPQKISASIDVFKATETLAPTKIPVPSPTFTLVPTSTNLSEYPYWANIVATNPIIPGVGIAGIELGFSKSHVIELLGQPTKPIDTVTLPQTEVLYYGLNYENKTSRIYIETNPISDAVNYIALSDDTFTPEGFLPKINGITLGSTMTDLKSVLGDPLSISEHPWCPLSQNDSSYIYYYSGIYFTICKSNGRIFQIGIVPK